MPPCGKSGRSDDARDWPFDGEVRLPVRSPRRRSGQCRRLQFPASTALKKSVGVGVIQNLP